jgi:hypothetical protein
MKTLFRPVAALMRDRQMFGGILAEAAYALALAGAGLVVCLLVRWT